MGQNMMKKSEFIASLDSNKGSQRSVNICTFSLQNYEQNFHPSNSLNNYL